MPATATHPERSALLDFAAKRLDDAETAVVARHLARCAACSALVASASIPAPAPLPTPDAATAAADETANVATVAPSAPGAASGFVRTEPMHRADPSEAASTAAIRATTASTRSSSTRRPRIIATVLAILVVILLAATAWYVSTDNWRGSSSSSDTSTESAPAPTQQV